MNQDNEAIPIGTWLRIQLPGMPTLIVYTYLDPQAGLSAKGGAQDDVNLAEAPSRTVRLPMPGSVWEALSEEEVRQRNLPQPPSWVDRFYGPQAELETPSGEWRHHPRLRGRFHPEFPDDLQVIVHDGGPRLSPNPAELVWVRVVHQEGELFRGEVLNQPHKLKSVRHGDEVLFIVPASGEHPLQVREKYLRERDDWIIHPCNKCGLSELFDAPSDLIRKIFPNSRADSAMGAFTSFCGACGGVQLVQHKTFNSDADHLEPGRVSPTKKWWQFWQ